MSEAFIYSGGGEWQGESLRWGESRLTLSSSTCPGARPLAGESLEGAKRTESSSVFQ